MSLIGALFGWSGKGDKEEPLCPLPVGGEPIKIDDDEQAIIDYEMHAWLQQEDSFNRQVSEITGMDISGGHGEFLNDQRTENEMYHYIKGLKRAAYTRYSEGEYSSAAGTCFKAIGLLGGFKMDNGYSGNGEAEIWYLLAHMHACTERFTIAKNMLAAAKKKAKHDRDPYLMPMEWGLLVRLLELATRSKRPPHPIENLAEARFSF